MYRKKLHSKKHPHEPFCLLRPTSGNSLLPSRIFLSFQTRRWNDSMSFLSEEFKEVNFRNLPRISKSLWVDVYNLTSRWGAINFNLRLTSMCIPQNILYKYSYFINFIRIWKILIFPFWKKKNYSAILRIIFFKYS